MSKFLPTNVFIQAHKRVFLIITCLYSLGGLFLLTRQEIKTVDFGTNATEMNYEILDSSDHDSEEMSNINSVMLPWCSEKPDKLIGRLTVEQEAPSWSELESLHPDVIDGHYMPEHCRANQRVAIIIPIRDREEHLRILLYNLLPVLKRQEIEFGIYIAEQEKDSSHFNRAALMNVGYLMASVEYDYNCFIFSDVDLVPEDDRNLYMCDEKHPKHMSTVDSANGYVPVAQIGGVASVSRTQFVVANGYSNAFWGWGREDDDFYNRLQHHGYKVVDVPEEIGRYTMLKHRKREASPTGIRCKRTGPKRYHTDGINSIKYEVLETTNTKFYRRQRVRISFQDLCR